MLLLAVDALGGSEISAAVLLLALPLAHTLALGMATLLTLGFLEYLLFTWRFAHGAPCA